MYNLIYKESIKNIGEGYIYNHKKTDAKIVYIKNNDKNKVFSITFKTLPEDSTGVQHITEHCVLAGSKKYPLKEPFNQLDKCTLNTYLNAITFADKTLYPIASMNDKDFFKLLDVYLDGVFFPLIYDKKGIFLQEGWHFNGEEVNGVVYNEMKGAYSSPDAIIDYKVKKNIFKTGYGFDSGGYPDEITNLTYEKFLNFHKQYYNPTNSIIYFYGDLDIDFYLNYIDREYLSKFEKGKNYKINKSNNIIKNKIIEDTYYLEDENLKEKNYLQATYKLKFSLEQEKNIAFEMLSNILTENQEGILKNALIKEGICSDVTSYIDDDMIQPIFTIQIEGTNEQDICKFKEIIEKTINNIKITEETILANFAPIEFYLKEGDFGYKPKGLFYNIILLKDMLYNKFDFASLDFENIIQKAKNLDLVNLLKENIIENEYFTYCILKATNKKEKDLEIKKEFKENTRELKIYQNEKDTKENLAKIPPLPIEDIEKEVFKINSNCISLKDTLEQFSINEQLNKNLNIPLVYNKIDTEIFYINFAFDIKDFGTNPYITLFSYLFDKMGTKKTNINELELKFNYLFGDYKIYNGCYDLDYSLNTYLPVLTFSARILEQNLESAFLLIDELFTQIDFNDKQKIVTLIKEAINKLELSYLKDAKDSVCRRARSYTNEKYNYLENIKGIEFYNWLKNINLENDIDNLIINLNFIKENIYCSKRLYLAITSNEKNYKTFLKNVKNFNFFNFNNVKSFIFENKIKNNEVFIIPSEINFNCLVCDLNEYGFKYDGKINVLKTILNTDYIWEKIRTEGGAYGGAISINRDGILCLNSYSDPNIKNTYNNFYNIANYIKNLNIDEDMLHMYKIGTINSFDRNIKDNEINEIALARYFSKRTNEDALKEKNEILYTKLEDIKSYFQIFEKAFEKALICTIGNKEDIEQDKNIFNNNKKLV